MDVLKKLASHFYAHIDYDDPYVQPLILAALQKVLPSSAYTVISHIDSLPDPMEPLLQITAYESIDFEHMMTHPEMALMNAYIIRKALIRKHYLSNTVVHWVTKNPASILATNLKPACHFELDFAEFLDDALVEAWDLRASFQRGEGKEVPSERDWWILKPGMSDRGQGIRLFSTEDELQAIFDEWEAERPDSEDDDEAIDPITPMNIDGELRASSKDDGDFMVTSDLRHFIAQPYIHPPLLLPGNPRKFHIRTYILAVGSLKIYVYQPMLALFAATPYVPPWSVSSDQESLAAHLTNTCLQSGSHDGTVMAFWSLDLPNAIKDSIFSQICNVTGEVFEAAAKGMMVHFQTLPNAFELFGLDFLVDANGTAWLLEVNAFPDFRQTGDELKDLVGGFWEGVVHKAVVPFFGVQGAKDETGDSMVLVKELDLGRG